MTPDGLPPGHDQSAWHRRFPDQPLWSGRLRLWRVELPVSPTTPPSVLSEWIARAASDSLATTARRLGLPEAVIAAQVGRPTRQTFAFLDLPTGRRQVPPPSTVFDRWPDPVDAVPEDVLRPAGVSLGPVSGDWRTVPVVWVEAADVIAVRVEGVIQVFAADAPEAEPLWVLPADAFVADS